MMMVCERFPKIGTIRDYMDLPPGEKALYDQYTLYAVQQEAKQKRAQVIQFTSKKK